MRHSARYFLLLVYVGVYSLWLQAAAAAPAPSAATDPTPAKPAPVSAAAPALESAPQAESIKVSSPDGKIVVSIAVAGPLRYDVQVDGQPIIEGARLGLQLRPGGTLGADVELLSSTTRSEDSAWENRFGKRRFVRNQYREQTLLLHERSSKDRNFQLLVRVFDDGVAFRYVLLSQPGLREFTLERELTEFRFSADATCFAGETQQGFHSPQEWEFRRQQLSEIKPETIKGLPLLIQTPAAWVAIAEADLLDWAGMWIGGAPQEKAETESADAKQTTAITAETTAAGTDPANSPTAVTLVAKLAPRLDGEGLVKGSTPRHSPWRVLMIGRRPGELIESEIIRNLSTPSKLTDTQWIQPGMMAWDHWWTGDTVMDTATIKSYIQLAADMGWKYQLIDWQWYGEPNKPEANITHVIPALNMEEVRAFAAERGVRLWLWLHSNDVDRGLTGKLERNEEPAYKKAFPLYEQWGIAGVKIDFMDRDDQEMVQWYEKIAAAAAEHKLMVNFHGAFKPSGFERTYPNQITREGILGNEYNKWSSQVTAEHKVVLPFTRFLVGPADFTPGGFLNRQPAKFQFKQKPTEVQGTRAGELALFVCYDSPICCVCDHPDHLRGQAGAEFLKLVPTVWDDTRVPAAAVGEYVVMARQAGDKWFLGAMNNQDAREISTPLDFLDGGRWRLKLWHDAADSDEHAEHVEATEQLVSAGETLSLKLAPGGGAVGILERE